MRVWPWFVAGSLVSALLPGFLFGALLFLLRLPADSRQLWEVAAGQAHGHLQVFGWAGLMVLGVGMHFLPRLRGAPPVDSRVAHAALGLLAAGLTLRAISQPLAATPVPSGIARAGLLSSGIFELAGASAALFGVARSLRQPSARGGSGAFRQVMPFLLAAGVGYWLANLSNLAAVAGAVVDDAPLLANWHTATVLLGFYGFLLPISLGMSIRLFPLYIQAFPARVRLLVAALAAIEAGLALRIWTGEGGPAGAGATGGLFQAAGLVLAIAGVRVFGERRQLPRRQVRPLTDPLQMHVITAYGWLSIVATLLVLGSLREFGLSVREIPGGAEFHALGAGFVTLLILGAGGHLLPGFASIRLRSQQLAWPTLVLANLAVLLRLVPEWSGGPQSTIEPLSGTLAGLAGAAAVALFAWNTGLGWRWFAGDRQGGRGSASGPA